MLYNCFRFAPRDSIPGLISKICKYLKDHPGWSEDELKEQIKKFISETGVESFNGRTGIVTLDKNDVNNLKIASAYFAEGDESIDSLDLVSLYNQGIRFVFTDFNSVTSEYNKTFALEYFSGSGNVVYYPIYTGSSGGVNIVSVNGKTGVVDLKVVDVSKGNSTDENAYIFIDEDEEYPEVVATDSAKLGGQLPEHYATEQSVNQLKGDKANKSDVLTYEEIQASTDLSGKIAGASSLKELDAEYVNFRNTDWLVGVDLDNYTKSGIYHTGYNIINSPVGAELWSPVLVLGNGRDTARQIVVSSSRTIYIRTFQSATWSDWKTIS